MKAIGHHIVMQLCDGRVLAATPSTRRQLARSVLKVSRDSELLAFAQPDNHLHGVDHDPLHESTNLCDLLGLRLTGQYTSANVRRYLPRIRRVQLLEWLGAPNLEPTDLSIDQVMDAALSASGLVNLQGSCSEVVATRRAIAKIVGRRIPPGDLATLLGVSSRTAFRLLRSSPDPRLEHAIRLQLGLRRCLRQRSQ
jgi:hypothetical protein